MNQESARADPVWVLTGVAAASFFGTIAIAALAIGAAMAGGTPGVFVLVIIAGVALETFLAYAYAGRSRIQDRRWVLWISSAPTIVGAVLTGLVVAWFWWLR